MTQIVVLSGGMDSATVLGAVMAEHQPRQVMAVGFDYHQRHRRELDSAKALARHYGVIYRIVPTGVLGLGGSALTGGSRMVAVPEGHYAEESMAQTVVQGRNLLFAAIACALTAPGDSLWFGVHAGDHPVYRDCRPEFWDRLDDVMDDAYDVSLVTPFLHRSKADIARIGHELDVPFDLTWSCYVGGDLHCGRCGTCVERAEAFHLADVEDPTVYADPSFWRETVGL